MASKSKPVDPVEEMTVDAQAEETQEAEKDREIAELRAQIAEMRDLITQNAAPAEPEPEPAKDEWEEYIEVLVPRHGRGEEKCFFVAVNGRNAQIPANGKLQRLRKPHALALLASLEAEAKAEQFAEDLPHEGAPASFADLMAVINDLRQKLRQSGIEV